MKSKPSITARPSPLRNSKSSYLENPLKVQLLPPQLLQHLENPSLSTQPSLSRLKDQLLLENPNIYHFSEIRATTDGLSARRFSSVRIRSLIKALVLLYADSNHADLEREE
ncbi:hypothetical protein CDL15_Pgr008024 [Punica granatum]|uniref:Uncharacterized protein n=1 Tax=Punica granatum TaxID=22663 RepID=A0A218VSD1_PUNGR|nr:hypothetical protein CDL15_Pgr008024 [Punica granatum]PKI63959.1 hypothetical protein CRG98_015635 [Punica granatum]